MLLLLASLLEYTSLRLWGQSQSQWQCTLASVAKTVGRRQVGAAGQQQPWSFGTLYSLLWLLNRRVNMLWPCMQVTYFSGHKPLWRYWACTCTVA